MFVVDTITSINKRGQSNPFIHPARCRMSCSEITRCQITFAALMRISRSRSSFLCFSIRSSCSKNLRCERTSDDCSYHSSSCREKEVRYLCMSVYDGSLRDTENMFTSESDLDVLCTSSFHFLTSSSLLSSLPPSLLSFVGYEVRTLLFFCWCQFLHTGASHTAHL